MSGTNSNVPVSPGGRRFVSRDLANVVPPGGQATLGSGTFSITAGGDYAAQEGADLLKKLVVRRIITQPGEFFHLPNYGAGASPKSPVPGGGASALKALLEAQVRLEPDVQDVTATVTFQPSLSLLSILLAVQERSTGQVVRIGLNVSPRGLVVL